MTVKKKFSVKMLAVYMDMSIEDLAKGAEISPSHLKQVSAGNVQMTAADLIALSKYTGIDKEDIEWQTKKKK